MARTLEDVKQKLIQMLWVLLGDVDERPDMGGQLKSEILKSVVSACKALETP